MSIRHAVRRFDDLLGEVGSYRRPAPDLVSVMHKRISARSMIIEGEAMAFNKETAEFYPFQVTVQRKRNHGIEEMASQFPLALVTFDLLYVNGKDYTSRPYTTRRKELEERIKANQRVRLVERVAVDDAGELKRMKHKARTAKRDA